jgi:transposase
MAGTTRREFTDEFKREAVALWETSGRLQIDVAREVGIQPSLLRLSTGTEVSAIVGV